MLGVSAHPEDDRCEGAAGSWCLSGGVLCVQACRAGNAEVVRLLLLEGRAQHDVVDLWGQRPMSFAVAGRHQQCVQVLQVCVWGSHPIASILHSRRRLVLC